MRHATVSMLGAVAMLAGCSVAIGGQVDSATNRVTPIFLRSHGFRPSEDDPDIFVLKKVRLADVARDLGFSPATLRPTPSQPMHSDVRTVQIRDLHFVVQSEMRDSMGNVVSGSLGQSNALCSVSVGLKQMNGATEKGKVPLQRGSPLTGLVLSAGMKREDLEKLVADATGVESTYHVYTMHGQRGAMYQDGATVLVVRFKPGAPAPWIKTKEGNVQHLPPLDATVESWELKGE